MQRHWKSVLREFYSLKNGLSKLDLAIIATLAYSDIFDYPLTLNEIHRYLILEGAPCSAISKAFSQHKLRKYISLQHGYYVLRGREHLVQKRVKRGKNSELLWPIAFKYAWLIANLPYVRMVGITGSLSRNNVHSTSDIDFFIVSQHNRVWVSRLLVFIIQKLGSLRNIRLCPNYIISERNLAFQEQNLFTAYQLSQLIPITQISTYLRIWRKNPWIKQLLPNAQPYSHARMGRRVNQPIRKLAEILLDSPVGELIDRGERVRVQNKFGQNTNGESVFRKEKYKGHFSGHSKATLGLFVERLNNLF
jgi:hypothetical protein